MPRLANQVLDAYDDVEKSGLQKVAQKNPSIYMMTPEEKLGLEDHDHALTVITKHASKMNKYPIDSYDNTWLSNQYFDMYSHRLPEKAASVAAHHIKEACQKFGVKPTPAVEGMAKEAASNVYYEDKPLEAKPQQGHTKVSAAKELAEAQQIADNYNFAQYAFSTPDHVKMACHYFEKQASKMPTGVRHGYAAAIQKRAKELGMEARKGEVAKYASDYYSPQLDAHIRSRASLIEHQPKLKKGLDKLASKKKEVSPEKFAKALHSFDKQAKLDRYYGGYLTDPFQATFAQEPDPYEGYRTKVANEELNSEQIKKLVDTKIGKIKEYFGNDMAKELKKDPVAVFDSLPMDAKEIMVGFSDGSL